MASNESPTILLLAGDGIGPEIVTQARRVLEDFIKQGDFVATISDAQVGGVAWLEEGDPLPEHVLAQAKKADAILLGAVGAPRFDLEAPRDKRPEVALLRLRKELDLFANLRPAKCFKALAGASSLKPELVQGLDLLIVRELSAGVYFGKPRGEEKMPDGSSRWVDTQAYSEAEIVRITDVAFELARQRRAVLHSADKANVMETGYFWRKIVSERHKKKFSEVTLNHILADNCAMQLVREPKQFDIILTDNLFGDLLSDVAAMLTGSLGMLASASLGTRDEKSGRQNALYEPVHGSAPDIAGKGIANPLATILSLAMMLRISFEREDLASRVENAVETVLMRGLRTADIAISEKPISSEAMGDAIIAEL